MKHTGKLLSNMVIGLIAIVVAVNLVGAAISPYMDMIGKTLAFTIIAVVVVAANVGIYLLLSRLGLWSWLADRLGGGGTFNG